MKYTHLRLLFPAALVLLIFGCSKIDWKDAWGHHPAPPPCDIASYSLTLYPQVTHPFLFTKTYDASGKFIRTIDASFFNILPPDELIHYRLKVVFHGKNIYLINLDSPGDTSMTVRLNREGRPDTATGDETLGSYRFYYSNGRLSGFTWNFGVHFTCVYDDTGNILSITYPEAQHGRLGYFYTYDYSKKAKQQFYMDEVRTLDDGFTLLQYLSLFPELNPVNLRNHVRLGTETGSGVVWERALRNHQLDAKGRLIRYDIADSYQAVLDWNCR